MEGRILVAESEGACVLRLEGDVRLTLCARVDAFLDSMFSHPFESVVVDLSDAEGADSTTLGLLAKLAIRSESERSIRPTLFSDNQDLTRIVRSMGLERVFTIVEAPGGAAATAELPEVDVDDATLRRKILDAHQALVKLDERNAATFKDLIEALEDD